jgi:predicted transposase/invertase (TIGR01784 family)
MDGVLIPPDPTGTFLFTEVQMQPDPKLYERLCSEIFIYAYRHDHQCRQWQALVIYPNRAIEQDTTNVPPELFESGRIRSVCLDELGEIDQLPLGMGLLVLTVLEGNQAIAQAQSLMTRARSALNSNAIMEMISTIIIYKFNSLSRDEVNAMLGYTIDELKQTRVYQEAMLEEAYTLVLGQLADQVGVLPSALVSQIQALPLPQVQTLSRALLRFTQLSDLQQWLQQNAQP